MSLLYAVLFASRCRSNHHRLALEALQRLKAPDAEAWRDLFLHHHSEYLAGAKAPDDEFKDFKNHVLHVREGEWGGAIEACEEWYQRTVRALQKRDWKQAAWSAGVLSHYYVDPIQPFHTHQTEAEAVIHRAVEQSFSKSYKAFQAMLGASGYPRVETPSGEDWLAAMVRAGARASNESYDLIIDHYDFEKGARDPKAGLDDAICAAIAPLVGHAIVGLAAIFDRAIEEAGVMPARVTGALQALLLTLEMPIQALAAAIEDGAARREVLAQYEEYRRTGKVRATLGEDDRVVRELHAAEVLKTPLSSLDAKWPREIGAKAQARASSRIARQGPAATRPTAKIIELDVVPAPRPARQVKAPPPLPRELPVGAPLAKREKALPRCTLTDAAPVVQAPSIGPKTAKRLEALGVKTVADLLALAPEEAERNADARHISAQVIRDWQAQALLACTVPGLKSREAQALVACGVRSGADLARADALALCDAVARWGLSEEGQRAWGAAPAPNEDDVATWIARAKRAGKAASAA